LLGSGVHLLPVVGGHDEVGGPRIDVVNWDQRDEHVEGIRWIGLEIDTLRTS